MPSNLSPRTARDFRLAVYAVFILLEARLRLRYKSVEQTRRWAAKTGFRSCARQQLLIAFRRASARMDETCLVRSLALQRLLSRYDHASELRLGVGRTERGFEAHAWLVSGDEVLDGEGPESREFTLLATWPTGKYS